MVIQPPFQSDPSYKVNSNMYFWFHHLPRPISLTWSAEENSPVNCLMAAFWPRTQSMTALAGAVSQHAALEWCTWCRKLRAKSPCTAHGNLWMVNTSHMFFPTEAGHILCTNPFFLMLTTIWWGTSHNYHHLDLQQLSSWGNDASLSTWPQLLFPSRSRCARLTLPHIARQQYLFSLCLFWTEQTF